MKNNEEKSVDQCHTASKHWDKNLLCRLADLRAYTLNHYAKGDISFMGACSEQDENDE